MKLKDDIIAKELEKQITDALKKKFEEQGHSLTGKGINSLQTIVKDELGGLIIQILGEEYMGFQDAGRKAGKMPPIEPLMRWVKLRGLASDMKAVKRIAFAIAMNMKKIGMHSSGSRIDLSKRHFISDTITNETGFIQDSLFKMFNKNFDLMVTNYTKELQKTKTIIST
jgi:hypothetical protein